MIKWIFLNKLDERYKISIFVVVAIVFFVLSGVSADSALDGSVRIISQSVLLCNLFAYLYDLTMYGPHLYLKYSEESVGGQVGRFVFMLVCLLLGVVCVLY